MKKIKRILMCLLLMLSILSISSCKKHEHTFEEGYTYNATEHWHAATCKHKDEVIRSTK